MVRVHSGLPFSSAAPFCTCHFLPVFAVFRGTSPTMKWHNLVPARPVLRSIIVGWRARALTLSCASGVFNFS